MKDFILPDIGEGIVECELLKWLVSEGDVIVEDQAVAEVMTDKATVEIPAMHNGVVNKLYYKEGDIAKVHAPLFAMTSDEDAALASHPDKSASEDTHGSASQNSASQDTHSSSASQSASQDTHSNDVPTGQQVEAFVLPDIGEGIVECEIMQWHISEGDSVLEDQVVVEVMTDKAVVEIPAKYQGKILKLHYQKGDIAKVHTPLFDQLIGAMSLASGSSERELANVSADSNSLSSQALNKDAPSKAESDNKQGENFAAPVAVNRAIASPAVRRLARELGFSLDGVKGTGQKGRVLKQDVRSMANSGEQSARDASPSQNSTQGSNSAQIAQAVTIGTTSSTASSAPMREQRMHSVDRVESIKGIRAAMARQMVASVSTIPHFTVSDELCMDKLITLRAQLKPEFEKNNVKLSFMPFFIKALSLALIDYPVVNSRLNEAATELTYLSSHNIGLAVDSKIGLLVPSIKNVQDLSLFEVAKELNRIIDAAREGKLSNADLQGGSISISNIGAIGGITATPVINKPDVAIVALGKTQSLPRFDANGQVVARNIMMINWSGDHRVIDGATMVKFNNLWMDYLCHPEKMLVHLR